MFFLKTFFLRPSSDAAAPHARIVEILITPLNHYFLNSAQYNFACLWWVVAAIQGPGFCMISFSWELFRPVMIWEI